MASDCQFFNGSTPEEAALPRIEQTSAPGLVFGCGNPQGDGPLFFFVPVPGGAVRVPVCTEHAERLAQLYGNWAT